MNEIIGDIKPAARAHERNERRTSADRIVILRSQRTALWVISATCILFAIWAAQAILIPIAAAVFIAILLDPPVEWLTRMRIPRFLGALIVLLSFLSIMIFGIINLSTAAVAWIDRWPSITADLEGKLEGLRNSLQQASRAEKAISEITDIGSTTRRQAVAIEPPSILLRALNTSGKFMVGVGACLFLTLFLLASGPRTFALFIVALPRRAQRYWTRHYAASTQKAVVLYIRTLAAVNIAVGTLVGFILYGINFPNPLLFGTIVAILNAVPYIGPAVIAALLGIVSVITFDSPFQWLLPVGLFWLIHLIEANVVTPLLLGRRLSLNPIAVMVMLLLCGWLWGVAGLILAVPILIAIKVVIDSTGAFAVLRPLFGDERERKLP